MWRSIRRTSWVRDPWRALQGLDRIKGFLNALRQDPYHEPGDGVLRARVITLHRPQQPNALNDVLVDEPGAALLAYDAGDCIGCIVVFGSESFAAGADIAAIANLDFAEVGKRALHHAQLRNDMSGAQACNSCYRGLCAWRWLSARDDVRLYYRCRQRPVRSACNRARHHPQACKRRRVYTCIASRGIPRHGVVCAGHGHRHRT
ncbi:enoyl-CoA hydratase-related protein [Paraburkholderia hospita]|uniref:enoyl-CoA hydratase-related protein n=1 Tax=Paraburkholderia hospita TaxID=169430 RepID=UPI001F60634D|nr:enoyl-CoA hydratase-related protein [Paraburkholderia hospita]